MLRITKHLIHWAAYYQHKTIQSLQEALVSEHLACEKNVTTIFLDFKILIKLHAYFI